MIATWRVLGMRKSVQYSRGNAFRTELYDLKNAHYGGSTGLSCHTIFSDQLYAYLDKLHQK